MPNRSPSRTRSNIVVGLAATLLFAAGCSGGEPALALPVPGPISGDPIALTYQMKTGQVWRFDVEAVQRMGAGGEGGPRVTLRYTLVLRVALGRADGGGRIALAFENLETKSDPPSPMAGGGLKFDDVDITAVMTGAGAVDDLQVIVPPGRDPDMYRTIVTYALMPFRLADRPVRVNEPWISEDEVPMRLMGLARALDFRSSMRTWITRTGADGIHLQIAGSVDLPKQKVDPQEGSIATGPVEVSSTGHVATQVVFDRERGMIDQLSSQMRSKMDILTGDDRIVVQADATTTMRLQPVVAVR